MSSKSSRCAVLSLLRFLRKRSGAVALFDLIYDRDDQFLFHVDRKADGHVCDAIEALINAHPNVHSIHSIEVTWGGWSQCRMELAALQFLCTESLKWDYLINLSGQDLPIKPIPQLRAYLAECAGASS